MKICCFSDRVGNIPLLLMLLFLTMLILGCSDKEGYRWIEVMPADQLEQAPRKFSIELVNPSLSDVWCSAEATICVAVGEGGNIKRSEDDGKTWTTVSSGTKTHLTAIHGAGKRLVAVGKNGVIVRSEDDGKTWTAVSSGTKTHLTAILGAGKRLVAVGKDGAIVRSEDDGKTWAAVSSATKTHLMAIHGAGESLVAVDEDGAIVRSEDDGKTWMAGTKSSLKAIYGVGERLVAVDRVGTIGRSEDGGNTWTALSSGTKTPLEDIHGAGERLVAVGWNGTIVRSENSGKTWTALSSGTKSRLLAIHGVGERLVAVGESGAIVRSEDGGNTWTAASIWTNARFLAIHCADERLLAVGEDGAIVRSENRGKTWTAMSSGTKAPLEAIHGAGERLVAVGGNGAIVRSEDGGKTWTVASSGTLAALDAIYAAGERLVAVGENGAIVRSEDGGKTWTAVSSGTKTHLTAIHGAGEKLVAVGGVKNFVNSGAIVRSEDGGNTWATAYSGTIAWLNVIHGAGEWLVAVGSNGAIVRSEDAGKTWTAASSGTKAWLNAIHSTGERLVAVGESGTIVRSEDAGKTWTAASSRTNNPFEAVHGPDDLLVAMGGDADKTWTTVSSGTYDSLEAIHGAGELLVAVGSNGAIVRSEDGGKTWTAMSSGTNTRLLAIHGASEQLVAVGNDIGTILLMSPIGARWPVLMKVGYRFSPGVGSPLLLRFELHDPDGLCREHQDCTLEAMGHNETDYKKRQNLNPLSLNRAGNTWEAAVNPKEFSVNSGENFYLEVLLKGPDFSLRYPIAKPEFPIPYQVDSRPFYVAIAIGIVAIVLALLYWLTPLCLLGLYRRLGVFEAAQNLDIPGLGEGVQMTLKATLLPWLITRPRILDAWVEKNLVVWKAVFEQVDAVARLNYYPLPLHRTETQETIHTPGPGNFVTDFSARYALLQIIGAGGSGKTSFAAQIGRWALERHLISHVLIPVWLDEDVADVRQWLIRRVREVVRDDDLPESFIHALFKAKRLLFIVDRLSERQASSREAMKHLPSWLAVVVVTSRHEIDLGLPFVKRIEPLGLDSTTVMGFLEALIENVNGSHEHLGYRPKAELALRFAEVITVGGKEERITPLLVSLFVKKALAQFASAPGDLLDAMPASIPDVYFEYLCSLNPEDEQAKNHLTREKMLLAAGILACAELGDDFRPKRIDQQEAEKTLATENLFGNVANPLQRLIDNQVLEQRQEGGGYLISFALDPVAEYLAAFAHAKRCGKDADAWRELIEKVSALGEQASGFMAALRITHRVYAASYGWTQPAPFSPSSAAD